MCRILSHPFFLVLISLVLLSSSCNDQVNTKKTEVNKRVKKAERKLTLISPDKNESFNIGSQLLIQFDNPESIEVTSVDVTINGKSLVFQSKLEDPIDINLDQAQLGPQSIRIKVFCGDSLLETHSQKISVMSDIVPDDLSFEVLREFDHDPKAYTQGLLFHNGYIYESTGQRQRSSIRKIDPKDGTVLKLHKLDDHFFGEGISLYNGLIYMLTYTSRVGFVFEPENFNLVRQFDLQTREGWGLTTYNNELVISDGSTMLFFYDPEYITQTGQLYVGDNKGLLTNLNELEFTPEGIFANIYGQNRIVRINPQNGVVTGSLDLSVLFPEDVPRDMDHVLNGIAYNKEQDSYFITGKQWPVMYEIRIK